MIKIPHIDRLHTIHSKASVALDELQREARNLVGQALESYDRLNLYSQQQGLTIAELRAEVRDLRAQLSLCKVHTQEAATLLRAPLEADLLQLAKDTREMAAAHPVAPGGAKTTVTTVTHHFTPEEIAESMRLDVDLPRIPAGGIPVVNESLSSTLKAFFGGK